MNTKTVIITFLAVSTLLLSCNKKDKNKSTDPPPPVVVTTYEVKPENVTYFDSYPGTVTALKEVGLHGQVTGYITGIFFTEGGQVHKGQKLYEIDRRQYVAAYKEASDNLKIANDNLVRTQRDYNRYSELNKQEAIAKQQFDHAMTDLANAKSQVSVATQEEVKAANNLEYSVITAPFDGSIGISQVKQGDLINPGQTLLNTISSDDPMGVDFVIDQSEVGRFQQLQTRKLPPEDSTFRLILPGNVNYQANGKIELIDRAVDPQTGTIKVRVIFPNADRNLRPGMNCNLRVMHGSAIPQVMIPFKAVLEQMGEYFVFLDHQDHAKQVKIILGQRVGSGVIIQDGLKPGDVIIVDGIAKVSDSTHVSTSSPPIRTSNALKR
jgi:membrane fusion protein (multidrug efflux system)